MSNYYRDSAAKVLLSQALKENGWKIFGFKADESDAMFDYYNPAHWDGIATKNGFVLVVDQYSTSLSGKEVRKYDYTKTRNTSDKVNKLQATVNDKAATAAEKETAQKLIEKLNAKGTGAEYTVLYTFPTFEHKTPRGCTWHIEKDGAIIAKGKGIYSLYDINEREASLDRMRGLVSKFENSVATDIELVAVEKQVKTKSIQVVKIDGATIEDLKADNTYIKLNISFTGGFYSGTTYLYKESFVKNEVFVKLGKKYQELKYTHANQLVLSRENLTKWINDGSIDIVELKEVEVITSKTVYVKQQRKQKVAETDVHLETTLHVEKVENDTVVVPEAIETVQTVEQTETATEGSNTNGITYKLNDEKNGIEIYFDDIPHEDVRAQLKSNSFKWSRYNKCWYAKQSENTISFAKNLAGEQVSAPDSATATTTEPFEYDLPEYVDVTQFKISEETEKRLIDNSLFGDRRDVGYETKQLQQTLKDIHDETVRVVEMIDNSYYKKRLIEGFNLFCERYSRELSNYLYTKSINPGWAVTGRGNINVNSYNKKMDRIDNKMLKVVAMLDKQKAVLKKYAYKAKAEKQRKEQQMIKEAIQNNALDVQFRTEKRSLLYYGYTYSSRAYISSNYFIMKVAGSYTIFECDTNKEVHSMKTTDKLGDAKNYVAYLESKLQTV